MDPALVQAVRKVYEAPDVIEALPRMLTLCDPEVETLPAREWPGLERRVYHGHDGMRSFFGALAEGFGRLRFALEGITDYGDVLVCDVRFHIEGRASGIETETRMAHLLRVRDGRVVRVEGHVDAPAAHAAARGAVSS